jgi:hypothetical protein
MNNIIARFNVKFIDQKLNEEIKNIIINLFGIEPSDFKRKIK